MKHIVISLLAASCTLNGIELDISQAILDAQFQKLVIPQEQEYKIPTLNQYGYMFTKFDPVVEHFLELIEKKPNLSFFEVGGAYGNVAEAALEKGAKNFYLNDCEERHLKSFVRKLKENEKTHLFQGLHLVYGRCPDDIKMPECSLDAILVNKVLHFFTPDTIDAFVQWLNSGLKSEGRVFVLTVSPFFKGHEEFLEEYQKKKQEGIRFPGYRSMYEESKFAQTIELKARPVSLLFMEIDTLKSLFQQHGFQIEKEFELDMVDGENSEWKPGKDMVGIIAYKP